MIISLIFFIISLSVKWNKQYWTRVLLWPACSLDTILLAFALLHFVLQGQTICNSVFLLTSYFHIPVPYDRKGIFCLVLVLEGIVGIHRTGQLQLLLHQWLGQRLGLLWYGMIWMICLGNKQIILSFFLRLHPSTAFLTLLLIMMANPFLLRNSCP